MTSSGYKFQLLGSNSVCACSERVKEFNNVTPSVVNNMACRAVTDEHNVRLDSLTRVARCTLDDDQCLSLQDILVSFQAAINEEQAWALCYETVKCFSQHYQSTSQCYLITDPLHLSIHKDGYVHPKSLFAKLPKTNNFEGMFYDLFLFYFILFYYYSLASLLLQY